MSETEGQKIIDSKLLRNALGNYPTGVAVVSIMVDGQPLGMTINSFSAVSLDPALVSWAIRKTSSKIKEYTEAENFTFSFMAKEQIDVAMQFAKGDAGAYQNAKWISAASGVPFLDGALVNLDCKKEHVYEGGDHLIIVGRVLDMKNHGGDPLVFAQGRFVEIKDTSDKKNEFSDGASIKDSHNISLNSKLRQAHENISGMLDVYRQELGLNVVSSRILTYLEASPKRADELATYIGSEHCIIQDVLDDLLKRKIIQEIAPEIYALADQGVALRASLIKKSQDMYKSIIADVDEKSFSAFMDVLNKLIHCKN